MGEKSSQLAEGAGGETDGGLVYLTKNPCCEQAKCLTSRNMDAREDQGEEREVPDKILRCVGSTRQPT